MELHQLHQNDKPLGMWGTARQRKTIPMNALASWNAFVIQLTGLNLVRKKENQRAVFIVITTALTKVGRREMVRSEVSYWIFTS